MSEAPTMKERSSQPVQINGEPWRFVVYEGGTYTLIDPAGRPIPPMDHLTPKQIATYRKAG